MANLLEEAAAKTVGMGKAAKARIGGMPSVFVRLCQEHGEVAVLMKRLEATHDASVRQRLYPEVRDLLLRHEAAELSELYPLLRQHARTRLLSDEHDSDARQMQGLLEAIDRTPYDAPEWMGAFGELARLVRLHVVEEETRYFPLAQRILSAQQLHDLDERYVMARRWAERNWRKSS